MLTKGNRRNGQPIFLENNETKALQRIPFDSKTFNESWIQKIIHDHPGILPVSEIEPSFNPLIAIGREIQTGAGCLDNLFVSPEGYITIVETKLWRNPEARREVVGQIIDYAKELSKWTFTDLDKEIISFNRRYHNNADGLLATVQKHADLDESDEQFFVDNISKNLKRGRFLLLIVGDGIRESVEDMIEYLDHLPQLHFTLALIELQVFRFNDENNSLLIMPQLVTRTKEITRAIVRIEGSFPADLKVNIETDLGTESDKTKTNAQKLLTLAAEDFFDQLQKNTNNQIVEFAKQIIRDAEDLNYFIEWNTGSYTVKLLDPQGSGIKISLFTVDRVAMVYLKFSDSQMTRLGLPVELMYDFAKDTAAIIPNIQYNTITKNSWNKYSKLSDLQPVYPQFMARVKKYVEDIELAGQRIQE